MSSINRIVGVLKISYIGSWHWTITGRACPLSIFLVLFYSPCSLLSFISFISFISPNHFTYRKDVYTLARLSSLLSPAINTYTFRKLASQAPTYSPCMHPASHLHILIWARPNEYSRESRVVSYLLWKNSHEERERLLK